MKKGFTLAELLAVITILGIIALVTVPTIINVLSSSRSNLNNTQKDAIIQAARNWGSVNLRVEDDKIYNKNREVSYVTIDDLQKSGYLDKKDVKDMNNTKVPIDSNTKICISYSNNQLIYEYDGEC